MTWYKIGEKPLKIMSSVLVLFQFVDHSGFEQKNICAAKVLPGRACMEKLIKENLNAINAPETYDVLFSVTDAPAEDKYITHWRHLPLDLPEGL